MVSREKLEALVKKAVDEGYQACYEKMRAENCEHQYYAVSNPGYSCYKLRDYSRENPHAPCAPDFQDCPLHKAGPSKPGSFKAAMGILAPDDGAEGESADKEARE